MSGTEPKYERIIRYLKGLLSNRERHELEKEMMQDAFEEEAFEGLTRLSGDELETDMDVLRNQLKDRVKPARKRSLGLFYRIAAGIMLLAGIAGILYLVFRMPSKSLITQETGKVIHQAPPPVMAPSMPDTVMPAKGKSEEKPQTVQSMPAMREKSEAQEFESKEEVIAESPAEPMAAEVVQEENRSEREAAPEEYKEPAASRQKSEVVSPVAMDKSMAVLPLAKVVDMDGNPLPGVTVIEKGTTRGTITDIDGLFSLQEFDPGSVLALSYVGFVSEEVNAKDIAGKDIPMTEDLTALDEVVVVGYGVQKRSDETGAVTMQMAEDISPGGNAEVSTFQNPVPPGGSAKAFKQWVYERLDVSIVNAFPEKQKILVNITVQADGSVSDIRIKESVPEPLAREFRRVITQSPRWKPATKDEMPVSTKVAIRFVVGEE